MPGRQLAVFRGLRLHCPGDDQLDIQHGNLPYVCNGQLPTAAWDAGSKRPSRGEFFESCTGVPTVMPLRGCATGHVIHNALPLRMSPRVYDGSAGVPVVGDALDDDEMHGLDARGCVLGVASTTRSLRSGSACRSAPSGRLQPRRLPEMATPTSSRCRRDMHLVGRYHGGLELVVARRLPDISGPNAPR